ncbi:glutamate--tRNA ligase family protein, partial [Enterococcus faecium]|uniref:glutamate--tRNA ligase family protein n=1 Tax=Enterococcus faecium TaxID=1352 RepID=UPI003F42D6FC
NALCAARAGGSLLLRLDDTDRERSRPEYAAAIEEDLAWLGISWSAFLRQSDRLARYGEVAERLKREGRLYPCFETEAELKAKREARLRRGLSPLYD